jgi:hypothetical protein
VPRHGVRSPALLAALIAELINLGLIHGSRERVVHSFVRQGQGIAGKPDHGRIARCATVAPVEARVFTPRLGCPWLPIICN